MAEISLRLNQWWLSLWFRQSLNQWALNQWALSLWFRQSLTAVKNGHLRQL